MSSVLALDVSGSPKAWISTRDTVGYMLANKVVWSLGSSIATYRSTVQSDGRQTIVTTPSIVAITGKITARPVTRVNLTNRTLFGRDRNMCCYCGEQFQHYNELSRDHVVPISRGGENTWTNVVTACHGCNSKKADKTPQEAKMPMLYVPYVPHHYENMILQNRNILGNQMEYLLSKLNKKH
jgi:5-methylcytosine-specific restriction endonuclease McrA